MDVSEQDSDQEGTARPGQAAVSHAVARQRVDVSPDRPQARVDEPAAGHGQAAATAGPGGRAHASSAANQARDRAAADRTRAAADRTRAAADRTRAAADREAAARDRVLARAELMKARARNGEDVGALAGTIAHNLNNLMAIVVGYANRLVAGAQGATTREDLEQIIAAADRATALTKALLAFAGLAKSGKTPVDPAQAIRDLEPRLRALADAGVGFDLRLDPQEILVMVDAAEFDQAIINLAINASDTMPDGGTITLTSAHRAVASEEAQRHGVHAGCYAEVSVADTGAGIAADTCERIFDPFFTTKGSANTGLGLATLRAIVEHAGGWIDVQTEIGAGTTLRMALPEAEPATQPSL
jgi:signal transduction histidine kinase